MYHQRSPRFHCDPSVPSPQAFQDLSGADLCGPCVSGLLGQPSADRAPNRESERRPSAKRAPTERRPSADRAPNRATKRYQPASLRRLAVPPRPVWRVGVARGSKTSVPPIRAFHPSGPSNAGPTSSTEARSRRRLGPAPWTRPRRAPPAEARDGLRTGGPLH